MPLLAVNELGTVSPIFRGRAGNVFARVLMHFLNVDKLNDLYDRNSHLLGPDFSASVLKDIGVSYEIENPEKLECLPDGPFVTISNHPYGGIDGIILVDVFGRLRNGYKVMVNEMLSRIHSLDDSFICVTPTGTERKLPSSESIKGIKAAVAHVRQGGPLGIFPSGAVSDLSVKDRCVRDREWQKPVIRLISGLDVPVVPVTFLDRNSDFYYLLGLLDWRIRVLRLPSELFNKKGRKVRLRVGDVIMPEEMRAFQDIDGLSSSLRSKVYGTDKSQSYE